MPRRLLEEIKPNNSPSHHLNLFQLGEISGLAKAGLKNHEIKAVVGYAKSTVYSTIKRILNNGTTTSTKRPGRPITYTVRDERVIVYTVYKNPRLSLRKISAELGVKLYNRTIKKILKKVGITY